MATATQSGTARKVFFSYAHKDEDLKDDLVRHLKSLQSMGMIEAWDDREIDVGTEWAQEIDDRLNDAEIILLLVSASFMGSHYCFNIEMIRAMERHDLNQAIVVPIILKPVYWKHAPFGKLQAVPKNGRPVVQWESVDEAFEHVTERIVQILKAGPSAKTSGQKQGFLTPIPQDSIKEPAPCKDSPRSATFDALASFIQSDTIVRDRAREFQSDFETVSRQVNRFSDHKEVHDLLHELQIHIYNVIVNASQYFAQDDSVREQLAEYESRLSQIISRLRTVTRGGSFPNQEIVWLDNLQQARVHLQRAVASDFGQESGAADLRMAIRLMKSILAREPSKIDARLSDLSHEFRLDRLALAMSGISKFLEERGITADKLNHFKGGAANLYLLNQKLKTFVDHHYVWQDVDDDLRRIGDLLGTGVEELELSLPDLSIRIPALCESLIPERADQFLSEWKKLNHQVATKNPRKTRQSFRRFRALATEYFYETDKRLRDLCNELRVVGTPLNSILALLRAK
jgi:hypothetical protein